MAAATATFAAARATTAAAVVLPPVSAVAALFVGAVFLLFLLRGRSPNGVPGIVVGHPKSFCKSKGRGGPHVALPRALVRFRSRPFSRKELRRMQWRLPDHRQESGGLGHDRGPQLGRKLLSRQRGHKLDVIFEEGCVPRPFRPRVDALLARRRRGVGSSSRRSCLNVAVQRFLRRRCHRNCVPFRVLGLRDVSLNLLGAPLTLEHRPAAEPIRSEAWGWLLG